MQDRCFFNGHRLRGFFIVILGVLFSGCIGSRATTEESFDATKIAFDTSTMPAVVLGGGVAGLTAALYFSQANIPCMLVVGPKQGGALSQSHLVRNWPGVLGAPGAEIVNDMLEQVKAGGVRIVDATAVSIDVLQWPRVINLKMINDGSMQQIRALTVVNAMGMEPNLLGIPGESGPDGYWARGVSNCAVCEGSLYKDKVVAVVGGGDAAVVEADYLADIAQKVLILIRKDEFRAKDIKAKEKLLKKPQVTVIFNTEVRAIEGDGKRVTQIVTINNKTKKVQKIPVDGVFLAIGSHANTGLLQDKVEFDAQKFIVLKRGQESSVRGVYAAGDICSTERDFAQAVVAASDGCKAALQAIKFLKTTGFDRSLMKSKEQVDEADQLPVAEKKEQTYSVPKTTDVMGVKEIMSEADFQTWVLNAQQPTVVDLFATWCIPCQKMSPIVDELAEEMGGAVSFVKLNITNKSFDVARMINKIGGQPVQSVPTFLLLSNGKEVGRLIGFQEVDLFKQRIKTMFMIK